MSSSSLGKYLALIRYARCCQHFRHFAERSKLLIDRLTNQGFQFALLKTVFEKFVVTYYELLFKYGDCDFEKMKKYVNFLQDFPQNIIIITRITHTHENKTNKQTNKK